MCKTSCGGKNCKCKTNKEDEVELIFEDFDDNLDKPLELIREISVEEQFHRAGVLQELGFMDGFVKDIYVSTRVYAAWIGVSQRTIQRWCLNGEYGSAGRWRCSRLEHVIDATGKYLVKVNLEKDVW